MAKKRTYTENIIEAFLEHDKISEIMRITGLSRNTLTRYRDDPQFQDILNQRMGPDHPPKCTENATVPF